MSNKSTQFAQNTSIAKQNLRNGKTIDYEKNLAEFRNVISYIDAQLKEGKDNPLTIKTCQNLIQTLSALDLPADVKRHELAVAPSGVQKLYQQMAQSKNGNSSSSKIKQEAMHNAIQQSLKDQIANLHNMSKAERMEFYNSIMTAESLQEAIDKGFVINDEYLNAFIDKTKADAQRLAYLKNRSAELNEKRINGTMTQKERAELKLCQKEMAAAQITVNENRKVFRIINEEFQNGKTNVSQGTWNNWRIIVNSDKFSVPVKSPLAKPKSVDWKIQTNVPPKNGSADPYYIRKDDTGKNLRQGMFGKSYDSIPDIPINNTGRNGQTTVSQETRNNWRIIANSDNFDLDKSSVPVKSPLARQKGVVQNGQTTVSQETGNLNVPHDVVASGSVETKSSLVDNFSQTYSSSTMLADDTGMVNNHSKNGDLEEKDQSQIEVKSDFWTKMDTPVVSNSSTNETKTVSEQTEPQNNLVSNKTDVTNMVSEPKKESSLKKTLAEKAEPKNDLISNKTGKKSEAKEDENAISKQSSAQSSDTPTYNVSDSITLSANTEQQNSSLAGTLSVASYKPYEPMTPSFGNAR